MKAGGAVEDEGWAAAWLTAEVTGEDDDEDRPNTLLVLLVALVAGRPLLMLPFCAAYASAAVAGVGNAIAVIACARLCFASTPFPPDDFFSSLTFAFSSSGAEGSAEDGRRHIRAPHRLQRLVSHGEQLAIHAQQDSTRGWPMRGTVRSSSRHGGQGQRRDGRTGGGKAIALVERFSEQTRRCAIIPTRREGCSDETAAPSVPTLELILSVADPDAIALLLLASTSSSVALPGADSCCRYMTPSSTERAWLRLSCSVGPCEP